jgi:indole-3-glycerol phosphate synthase
LAKCEEIKHKKSASLYADLRAIIDDMPPTKGFEAAIKNKSTKVALIAEVKKASPSKGIIRGDFDPVLLAEAYATGGAACISVLTNREFFMGSADDLRLVRKAIDLPILRKDFTIDELCVLEAREMGADCVLLIAAALSPMQLQDYAGLAAEIGLDALIEVHQAGEMPSALDCGSSLIGINNRDLGTFQTSLKTTEELAPMARNSTLVSESAISMPEDLERVAEVGVAAVLVGEALVRADDPAEAVRRLMGN